MEGPGRRRGWRPAAPGAAVIRSYQRPELRDQFQASGLASEIGAQWFFPTLPTAVEAYRDWAGRHR